MNRKASAGAGGILMANDGLNSVLQDWISGRRTTDSCILDDACVWLRKMELQISTCHPIGLGMVAVESYPDLGLENLECK